MSQPFRIRTGSWQQLGDAAYAIRFEVFVQEQGVPVELERDEHDASALHALLHDASGEAVGTARLLPDGHIGRVAVRAAWRGRGAGRLMMQTLMTAARERGDPVLHLYAQLAARGFYESLGFQPEGAPFLEAGILHLAMSCRLGRTPAAWA